MALAAPGPRLFRSCLLYLETMGKIIFQTVSLESGEPGARLTRPGAGRVVALCFVLSERFPVLCSLSPRGSSWEARQGRPCHPQLPQRGDWFILAGHPSRGLSSVGRNGENQASSPTDRQAQAPLAPGDPSGALPCPGVSGTDRPLSGGRGTTARPAWGLQAGAPSFPGLSRLTTASPLNSPAAVRDFI